MKNLSRDAKLGIGVLLLLVIVTVATTVDQAKQELPRLSTLSSAPNGARALKLWVEELEYRVDEQVLTNFVPPSDASVVFMLEPLLPNESEMQPLDDWVESGGTLIAIGEQYYGMNLLIDHYQFYFTYLSEQNVSPASETPLLDSPATLHLENAKVRVALGSERDDFVVLAAYHGQPVLVSFEQGDGRVILGTVTDPFTNAGLKQAGNPEFVLNVLALAEDKGTIWFDEWHHGLRSGAEILGPGEFLRETPVGRSLLFVTFAIFIVLFSQGRGFGRPVPLPQEIKRRGAWEHVTGIANLSRRAAHRSAVMMQYHQQIKRKLGQRYRLDPGMDDKEYVDLLAGYHAALDKDALLNLLKRLKRKEISETEMVHLAAEAAKWIDH